MMHFYTIHAPPAPWYDYGDILVHGMTDHLGRRDGLLQLERTGPFVPPIIFPGAGPIVLTAVARGQLERSGLTGFSFRPVLKARIVAYDWQDWDESQDEPREYPESGEPEDYILSRPHDEGVAEALGEIWELDVPVTAEIVRGSAIRLGAASWTGSDFFRAEGALYTYVTEQARTWLEANFARKVAFAPTPTV